MAAIRESLVLEDRFSAVFSSYLNLGRQIASNMRVVTETQNGFTEAAAQSGAALEEMAGAGSHATASIEEFKRSSQEMAETSGRASDSQDRLNRSMRSGASAADSLTRRVMGLAAAYVGLRSAQQLIGLSDTWTQTTARLGMVNEKYGTDADLNEMIRQSATRSRASYLDTADAVSKMALNAGAAFSAPEEVVAFMEQINKQFAIAGASATEQKNAMIQLTQAMAAGTLRGEELNSVLDQAPTIARSIEQYMGIAEGSIKSYAEQGLITAEVVKNAMLATAKETNAAFDSIPLTFSQAMTLVKNEGLNALRPVLEELNAFLNSDIGRDALNGFIAAVRMGGAMLLWLVQLVESGAHIVADNMDFVSTAMQFAGGAILALTAISVASSVKRAAVWAIENWRIVLFVGLIGAAVTAMYAMGMSSEEVFAKIGSGAGWLYALVYNLVADAWNVIANLAEFIANAFDNPLAAVVRLFIDTFSAILGIIETVAGALDALTGANFSGLLPQFRAGLDAWADKVLPKTYTVNRLEKISYEDTMAQWANAGAGLGKALDNFDMSDFLSNMGGSGFDYEALLAASGINSTLSDIGADTKAIRSSVALSEEDIKLLVDMATREYVNNINLTSQTPIITVNNQSSGDSDLDGERIADAIAKILLKQSAAGTALAYP